MATKTNVSVDVLNRLRSEASIDYQTAVPIATPNADVIKEIGKVILDSPNLQNEFTSWLVNRIAKVVIWNGTFENPLRVFNKGLLEFGDVIEEVFVDLCRPYQYSESVAERKVFARVSANIKSAFHVVNCYIYYKQTINRAMIKKAFMSVDGVEDLVNKITGAMITSANYDDFQMCKYLIAKAALSGNCCIEAVSDITNEATAKAALKKFKALSNNFEILSRDYNTMSVANNSPKEDQYLIIDNDNDANLSVDALAYMFGPAFADNDAKKIRIDGFDKLDIDRLRYIMCPKNENGEPIEDPTSSDFEPFTPGELAALENIEAVLLDEAWFQNYTQLFETSSIRNPEGLSENMWLHIWRTYSFSPFANGVIFASGTNGVSAIEIDDSTVPTVTAGTGGSATIDVEVTVTGLVPKGEELVNFTVATSSGATGKATIDANGKLTWSNDFTAADTITVTVTSRADSTKTDSATITVAAAT